MKEYIINRFYEVSTYRNIIYLIAGLTGTQVSPDQVETIISGALAFAGFIGVILPDSIKKE
jgi:hypothetical protein